MRLRITFRGPLIAALALSVACAPRGGDGQGEALALSWENIFARNHGARQAAVSPDGAWVAVTASTPDFSGIFFVAVNGKSGPAPWVAGSSPVWFADGSGIVFSRGGDLWRVVAGSSEPVRITDDAGDERAHRPSPDGGTIAFYSGRDPGRFRLRLPALDIHARNRGRLRRRGGRGGAPPHSLLDPLAGAQLGYFVLAVNYRAGSSNADRLGKIFIRTGHGGAPDERPETYAISNTLARVPNVVAPTLVMHGEEDVRAPFRQFELAWFERWLR